MYSAYYKLKSWCDAKDVKGVWRMGRIKKKTKNVITVHFDGWSDKYKGVYCTHSKCLAPLRMFSRGYTGQERVALREWEYNEDHLTEHEKRMAKLAESDFKSLSPYELTMYLRGDLFVLVDCLFGFTYTNPTKDIKRVEAFLLTVLEFTYKWMDYAKNLPAPKSHEEYLTDAQSSVFCAGFEMFEIVRSILGYNKRTKKFFEKYKIFMSSLQYCKSFLENGVEKFLAVGHKYKFDETWPLMQILPLIFAQDLNENNEGVLKSYITQIISHMEENEDAINLTEHFASNFQTIVSSVYQEEQKVEIMGHFDILSESDKGKVLEVVIESPDGSFIEHDEISIPLEELLSPKASKKPSSSKMSSFNIPSEPMHSKEPKIFDFSKSSEPSRRNILSIDQVSKSEYDNLVNYINSKHSECIDMIYNYQEKYGKNDQNSKKFQECVTGTADVMELQILDRLEYLISRKQVLDAVGIVRWRKKICKIAMMNGWEVAEEVSKASIGDMKITKDRFIHANLSKLAMKFD